MAARVSAAPALQRAACCPGGPLSCRRPQAVPAGQPPGEPELRPRLSVSGRAPRASVGQGRRGLGAWGAHRGVAAGGGTRLCLLRLLPAGRSSDCQSLEVGFVGRAVMGR